MTQRKAIYAGTFDPITNGHVDIIKRALALVDKVVIAVAQNKVKAPLLSLKERVSLCEASLTGFQNVEVHSFDGLLVDFAKKQNATVLLRGLRAVSDFEHEKQLANVNRNLLSDIETIFLMPSKDFTFVSSSLVREIASVGGDVSQFVPSAVAKFISG